MNRIPLWIDLRDIPAKHRIPYLRAAGRVAAEAILVSPGDPEADRDDAFIVDGDRLDHQGIPAGRHVVIQKGRDQETAAQAEGIVLVEGKDWSIIPLENLIAARRDRPGTLYAVARSPEQCGVFRDTLEHGVHGVALAPGSPEDIEEADRILQAKGVPPPGRPSSDAGSDAETEGAEGDAAAETGAPAMDLVTGRITDIQDAGPGDRVCIDTTSIFHDGEGLLIGSTARGFALIHAETIESEYVRARPFRVNAGAVHSYLLGPEGKTRYLSELAAGDRVLAIDRHGATREMTVGRAKIERRPHTLIRWQGDDGEGSAVVQTAETIRLIRPDGSPVAVTELKIGDEVLVHHESAARHFGMPVDEALEER